MDETLSSKIVMNSKTLISDASKYAHNRYIYQTLLKVPSGYFCGIYGLRGIGKTVLLLQLAGKKENSLYFSADSHYLAEEDLYELISFFSRKGYTNLFIDEIHYKKEWKSSLKTAYDENLARIFFSGSSALEIGGGADLSRRALMYELKPLSLREYLLIKKGISLPQISPDGLFNLKERQEFIYKTRAANDFLSEYCVFGGMLYPSSDKEFFYNALSNALTKAIRSDLAYLRSISAAIEQDIYKILLRIALSPSGETSYSSISSKLSIPKSSLIRIIDDLVKIGLVMRIFPCGKQAVRKEPKLYLSFPMRNFLCSFHSALPDTGTLREEFFVSHAEKTCYLKGKRGEKTPDFLLFGKTVEIGGGSKNFRQNPDFIFEEGITLEEKKIPLYLMGFLY